jgi:hypothetical protein
MESTFHIDVGRRFVYWARVRYCFSGRIPGSAGRDGVSAWPRSDVFVRRRPALCRSLSAQERRDPDTVAVFSVRTNSQTRDRDEHGGTLCLGRIYQQFRAMGEQREVKAALEWLDLDRDAIPPGLTGEEQAAG